MKLNKASGIVVISIATLASTCDLAVAQLVDRTKSPNIANEGIAKTLAEQIGAGRGDIHTADSAAYVIGRDPFRAIKRGRQLFQRKFTQEDGVGPLADMGRGDMNVNLALGAGLVDSCAGCHGRPRGAAGAGGDVVTRPDSRDAPHLFGLGLKEMLADEITGDLRETRKIALAEAKAKNTPVTRTLTSKGIHYGALTARPNGSVDTSQVTGVDPDLRVRPFFAHGGKISIREFVIGALNDEMGLQAVDPELAAAKAGGHFVTPSGMVLDGALDQLEGPPAIDPGKNPEIPVSLVDYLEFYLLNYFKPATYKQTELTSAGRRLFDRIQCGTCHMPDLPIQHDRRVADVETTYDAQRGIFNNLFATATPLMNVADDGHGLPTLKTAKRQSFLVKNIYTDLKRHDLGPNFHERNYDGTLRTHFMTTPLWGIGTTAPYGHDGRSINLTEVILRHGGEAQSARDTFARLREFEKFVVLEFLNSLVIFPPDDTASNLNPGDRNAAGFPQSGHGSIKLTVLFNNPSDPE